MNANPTLNRQRSGAAMVIALVCLAVILLLSATIVRSLVFHQRQVRNDQQRLQSLWLAESAVERAVVALRSDPQFSGDLWRVELADELGPRSGVAEIRVEPDPTAEQQRHIHVLARWPDDRLHGSVHHKHLVITLPQAGDSP